MYSYYLDFLKSFKTFTAQAFPQIEHYQFNFADNAFLNYKLYQEHVKKYPMCHILLTDISVDDNKDFFRYIGGAHSESTVQLLASNNTKQASVIMDFKWVTMQIQVKIVLASTSDVLNYHNQVISLFPKNMMFYAYGYTSLINVDSYIKGWEATDDTDGLVYRSTNQKVEGFSRYHIEPLIRINSITNQVDISQELSVDINMEVRLKVPNIIGNKTIDNRIIKGIQIIVNTAQDAKDLPILIDMDNDFYSDRRQKLKRTYQLSKSDFNFETLGHYRLQIRVDQYDNVLNRPVAIYFVEDSTHPTTKVEFIEVPVVLDSMIIEKDVDGTMVQFYNLELFDAVTDLKFFKFTELSNVQLFVFA